MNRVVITGLGIVSCLGNDLSTVTESLKKGKSGIVANPIYKEKNMRCQVSGSININIKEHIDKRMLRFMSGAAAYSYIAMKQAKDDANLANEILTSGRCGLIAGSGAASLQHSIIAYENFNKGGVKRVGPYAVTKNMCSSVSACLATSFSIKGISYSISSACTTSLHCITNAYNLIKFGSQDVIFAGGGEEEDWFTSTLFDAMGALSSKYNDEPTKASRPYDKDRDGFVPSGGGAILVIESLEHAQNRGAKIYAEIIGIGTNSDGDNMVTPSGDGSKFCMELALNGINRNSIDYINTHGTSTPNGDIVELKSIKNVFNDKIPMLSSTKSLTGHSLGATGAQEVIYSTLMMQKNFVSASANIENLDHEAIGFPILFQAKETELNRVMSNSFGFGGTNASIILEKFKQKQV